MSDSTEEYAVIRGYYIAQIMRDCKSGFTVFRLNTGKETVICSGKVVLPNKGMKIEAAGKWENTKYGRQLCECTIKEIYTDKEGMREYLKAIPHIGESLANALIDRFGNQLYDTAVSANGVHRLQEVKGVTEEKAESVVRFLSQTKAYRELFEIISRHGGTYNVVPKIFRKYGDAAVAMLKTDPYIIGETFGMPFSVADNIARDYGVKPLSRVRIVGAIAYVLRKSLARGNCYMHYVDVCAATAKLLNVGQFQEALTTACIYSAMLDTKRFCIEESKIYLRDVYYDERKAAFAIQRLMENAIPMQNQTQEMLVDYAEKAVGHKYAEQQREAFALLLRGGIGIITGGPGTGKSTVVQGLLAAYQMVYPNKSIKLCAPTGRAAQRMKEVCRMPATTIHKLLEYCPYGDTVTCKNAADPIDADLLVVDECSMISLELAVLLFSAIRSGTQVILCGDINQLPSVGAGNVLKDMIASQKIPTVMLTKTYRQAAGSAIITNADRVLHGIPTLSTGKDFDLLIADNQKIPTIVKDLFLEYSKPNDVFALQVLTPGRRKWETASHELSKTLQATRSFDGPVLRYGDTIFHVSDKVMFIRNNYDVGYYNGDMGLVQRISGNELVVLVNGETLTIAEDYLDDIVLAYSVTIHKSQGSEYATVIVVLPEQPSNMLQRQLLYTAITRAKKKCIIVAAKGSVKAAVENKECSKRNSGLEERLRLLL